jgi:general secretion pathway protein M
MNQAGILDRLSLSFSAFWAVRDARERTMLGVAAMVVAFGLAYALLIDPAVSARKRLNNSLPELRQQVAQLRALAKEAAALSAASAAPKPAISREIIEAALARNGVKSQSVILTGDFAKVQLAASSFTNTMHWLDDMQKTALLVVTDANIVALPEPGMINATFTLRQPAHE